MMMTKTMKKIWKMNKLAQVRIHQIGKNSESCTFKWSSVRRALCGKTRLLIDLATRTSKIQNCCSIYFKVLPSIIIYVRIKQDCGVYSVK